LDFLPVKVKIGGRLLPLGTMEIKVLRFYPFPLKLRKAELLGYGDILIGNLLEIRGIKLLKKENGGIFIALPSIQNKNGSFIEIVRFTDRNLREEIRKALKDYYLKHYGEI